MRRVGLVFCLLLAALAAVLPGAAAELTPRGPEFVVNQFTKGFQSTPDLASLGTSGMVAVWMDGDDAEGGIKARLLDATGTPVAGELWVAQGATATSPPRVAGNGNGLFVVVWGSDSLRVWARLFQGEKPLGDAFQISPAVSLPTSYAIPDVGMDAAGNFTVAWLQQVNPQEHKVMARRFGPDGQPAGEAVQVNQNQLLGATFFIDLRIAVQDDGGFVVTWNAFGGRLRRFNGPSQTWEGEVFLATSIDFLMPLLYPEGDGAVVWVDTLSNKVRARRFDQAGSPQGAIVDVGSYEDFSFSPAAAAVNKSGQVLVVWPGHDGITGRLFDRFLQPLDQETLISLGEFLETEPVVAASPSGGFAALWTTGLIFRGTLPAIPPPPPATGRDGDVLGIAGRSIAGVCATDADTLCLGPNGRFAARVSWKKPSGEEGVGHPLALSRETGVFWFFGPGNLELMVKLIDGQEVNGYHWVYTGALSDVEYTLTVRDTVTGVEKSYRNPPGQIASRADVEAFPSTDVSEGDTPVAGVGETLLLGDQQRFRVTVDFHHPFQSGEIRRATAVPLTGDTGAFWFFGPRNLELMIKVLDGRSVNGRFWVYYGSLSDVRYTITVTDTVTGATKTYQNPPGRLISRADTGAF